MLLFVLLQDQPIHCLDHKTRCMSTPEINAMNTVRSHINDFKFFVHNYEQLLLENPEVWVDHICSILPAW